MRIPSPVKTTSNFLVFFWTALIAAGLLLTPAVVAAEDYYVATDGDDIHGTGTQADPWRTLHHGVSEINSNNNGDTLHLSAGTYSATHESSISQVEITADNVTIQGDPSGTLLDGENSDSWTEGFYIMAGTSGVTITELEIKNFSNSGISIYNTTNTTIQNCDLHDNSAKGILLDNCDNSNSIRRNKIYDNSTGIYIDGDSGACSPRIINNLIYNGPSLSTPTGIYIYTSPTNTASPTIYHNTLDGGGETGTIGIEISNNGGTVAPDIQYNIISNHEQGIIESETSSSPNLDYNDVYGNTTNYSGSGLSPGTNSLSQDPLYTAPGNYDYHLESGSPCIDTAITSLISQDLDRKTRPQGSEPDLGCYEYSGDNSPPAAPTYVNPEPFQVYAPDQEVTLTAGTFSDPEGDSHIASHWRIARADRDVFGYSDYPASFDSGETKNYLTEYTVPAKDLTPGLGYRWIVGYMDSGSGKITWSDEEKDKKWHEPEENLFVVGRQETETSRELSAGTTAADYQMLSYHHLPASPQVKDIIGDDLSHGYDPTQYRIGIYDNELNGGSYREYPNFSVHPGRAVWVLARNGLSVDVTGVPVTITKDVELPLQYNEQDGNGWNMIGPPNDRNYNWHYVEMVVYDAEGNIVFGPERIGNLDNTNEYIDTRLWQWRNGQYYDDITELEAGYGYWVKAKQKNVNLRFTVNAQAKLSNPGVMLALGLDNLQKLAGQMFSADPAIADNNSDSPPAPMGDLKSSEGESGSSSGFGCFISSARE